MKNVTWIATISIGLLIAVFADTNTVFSATTGNTTLVNNNNNATGTMTLTGATPDLVLNNTHGGFNMGGFASAANINTLLGTTLTTADTVTVSAMIDSIGGTGEIRSRGLNIGMAGSTGFVGTSGASDNLLLEIEAANNGSDVFLRQSFTGTTTPAFGIVQSSLEDGFSITLTADSAGYSFNLSDIEVSGSGATNAAVVGTFTGSQFVDNFGGGHFYLTAQKFNNGNVDLDVSSASMTVISTPEPPIVYTNDRPNVIMIYYDDMGYSDMGAYDTTQTSFTPNLDTFAAGAMQFTAGHSADAVCTPSRYALMTGRYCWRTSLKTGVNGGYTPSLIEDDRFTFAKMFQSLGYQTAMVGKWHIGMEFYDPAGELTGDLGNDTNILDNDDTTTSGDKIDFSHALTSTPYHHGFDYYFGTTASLDMPPYVWIENDTVLFKGGIVTNGTVDFSQAIPATNADLEEGAPVNSGNSTGSIRPGVYDPTFVVADYLQVQAAKVAEVIKDRGEDEEPFFIYIPMPAPHNPWSLQDEFVGDTPFSYGDYLVQTDHYTGQILDALADPDGNPLTDDSLVSNTVVFITSDNGIERSAQTASLPSGHDGNGPFRGVKRDNWEGGTRVPFLVRWPGVVMPGTSDFACWQGDFYASMAAYLRYDFTPEEAPDSESLLPILLGESMPTERREGMIQHSMKGQLAIVDQNGEWKLLDGTGSGGYDKTYDADDVYITNVDTTPFGSPKQLFNLLDDPGERTNRLLSATQADLDKEAELYALLNEIRGNTTYGTDGDSNVPPTDSDEDGIANYYENIYEGLDRDDPSDAPGDLEPDGLTNLEEYGIGTSPVDADSDDDRLGDYDEVMTYGTLPMSPHSDADELPDGDEVLIWGTDPLVADSDGDGATDDFELSVFTSPNNAGSVPSGSSGEIELSPADIQLAGYNGTVNDPAAVGGASSGWDAAGNTYVRSRRGTSDQHLKTQLFLRFDLSDIPAGFVSAHLRIHQVDRLNTSFSTDLQLARVTENWGTTAGSYPVYDSTGVTDAFLFGNNSDFGTAVNASGFFSGTIGVPGTDAGFDVTSIVEGWYNGTSSNYGFRVACADADFVASAFSELDDLATPGQNEALQLIITTLPASWTDQDSDEDGLLDSYEMDAFGNLSHSGDDDSDGDGISNFVEQTLGSDPDAIDSVPTFSMIQTNAADVAFSYHRYNQAGLGVEVLVSEDLTNWNPYTEFYTAADPAPASELGDDYDNVLLEPRTESPDHLYYKLNIYTK